MNIVFLDIDGVLNSMTYFKSRGKGKRDNHDEIDESRLPFLKQIIDQTNAHVVLSSTWRQLDDEKHTECNAMYKYLIDTLGKYNIKIMSKTPIIHMNRPFEIKTWIENRIDKDEITFVSLDDDFDKEHYEEYGIGDCLVKTSFYGEELGGLHQEHVNKAINILTKRK